MSELPNNRLVVVPGGLVVIGLAGLVYQYRAISTLEQRVADSEAVIASMAHDAASAHERAESQARRIELVENVPKPDAGS